MKEMKVRLTLTEGMLGTKAGNPELLETYIAAKHPEAVQDDELNNMPDINEELEHGTTFFNRMPDDENVPAIFDYQIKGFFKDTQGALNRLPDSKMPAHKKIIDGLIFVDERMIPIIMPDNGQIGICERPLRAQTPQGERVSIARSEEVPAGSTLEFTIVMMDERHEKQVRLWLDFGARRGLGQWRNSGKGRFTWEEVATA
jgi:hypothetical protein